MGRATAEIVIDRPADEVWKVVGVFGDLRWYPGVDHCTVAGHVRTTMTGGSAVEIDQREIARDEANRSYTYTPVAVRNAPPTEPGSGAFDLAALPGRYRVTISVTPAGEDASQMAFTMDYDRDHDPMAEMTCRTYESVLKHLKAQLER